MTRVLVSRIDSRIWVAILFGALALLALALGAASRAAATDEVPVVEWLEEMEAYFDAHPELKEQRSSGWKPFNRAKWYREPRATAGIANLGEARWRVWEEKSRRSAAAKSGASSWFLIGPANLSGRILDIEFDPTNPDMVYVGAASGGLWKSLDGGDSWTAMSDELPSLAIGAISVLPSNPDIVLIGTGEGTGAGAGDDGVGILKSTDAGQSWSLTGLSFPVTAGHGFHVMEVVPNTGTVLAGANDGLWRSTDDGDNWTRVKTGNYFDIKWKPDDPTVLYAAKGSGSSGNGVKTSTDDGITWTTIGSGQPASSLIGKTKIAVSAANPDVIYANYVNRSTAQTLGVYRSDDAGANWTELYTDNMTNSQGWYNLTLAVDPDNVNTVIAGGVSLWRSTDGGSNFSKTGDGFILGSDTEVHLDHHAIGYEPGSNSNVWVGNDGGVWKSTDDGASWISRREGIASYQFYDICVAQSDPAFSMGGAQDNGVPGRQGVEDWFVSNLLADGFVCNIHPNNVNKVYAEWQFGNHVKSLDGGASWSSAQNGITGSGAWLAPVAMDVTDPKQLYTATSSGIFRTDNRMNDWSLVGSQNAIWIDVSLANGDVVWTVNGVRPSVSTDDGNNWTDAASYGFPVGAETKVHAHPTEESTAFVTFSGYGSVAHVAMTTDLGANWTNVTGDFPSQPVNAMVVDPDDPINWYIGTDVGVWISTNSGVNWTPFDVGLPNVVVTDLEIRRGARKLVAGTYGRGAWETDLPQQITGVDVAGPAGPLNLMLDPPAPNPARDDVSFRFAARHDGPVSLDVYDVQGRRVGHVIDLARGDGLIRNVTWSARDLASGVYFARLTTGTESRTRRVVVTR